MPAYREPPQRSADDDSLVVIGEYIDSIDAEMARTGLESHGIEAFVIDVMSFNPLLSGLAGGIQLKVRESDAERAASLLGHMAGPDKNDGNDDDDGEEGEVRCPRCELAYCFFEHSRPEGKGAVSLLGLGHYLIGRARPKRWRCHRCLHEWDDSSDGPAALTRLHPDDPRPIFRLRRARRGMGLFLGLFAGIGVSAASALAGYPIGGFAMFAGPILGVWIGGMFTHDVCSQPGCRAPLAPGESECPRCRGTVAGVIRYAHEHYSEAAQVRRELAALRAKPGKGEGKKKGSAQREIPARGGRADRAASEKKQSFRESAMKGRGRASG